MSDSFTQLKLLEVLLNLCLGARCSSETGGKVFWLFNPKLVCNLVLCQPFGQSVKLLLALDFQHYLFVHNSHQTYFWHFQPAKRRLFTNLVHVIKVLSGTVGCGSRGVFAEPQSSC